MNHLSPRKRMSDTAHCMTFDETQKAISEGILGSQPFLAARLGSTELRAIWRSRLRSQLTALEIAKLELWRNEKILWSKTRHRDLQETSGFFPISRRNVDRFRLTFEESMRDIDILGSWVHGESLFQEFLANAKIADLGSLEPFFADKPWTLALKGLNVLVVHPFASSINRQFERRREIFDTEVLPEFDLKVYRAVQTGGGQREGFRSWFEALELMAEEVAKIDFDVALVGCGAYGLPLASRIKQQGNRVVHLGGSLQLLFGIRGKRWDDIPEYLALVNEHWARPSSEDTHPGSVRMEKGAYW